MEIIFKIRNAKAHLVPGVFKSLSLEIAEKRLVKILSLNDLVLLSDLLNASPRFISILFNWEILEISISNFITIIPKSNFDMERFCRILDKSDCENYVVNGFGMRLENRDRKWILDSPYSYGRIIVSPEIGNQKFLCMLQLLENKRGDSDSLEELFQLIPKTLLLSMKFLEFSFNNSFRNPNDDQFLLDGNHNYFDRENTTLLNPENFCFWSYSNWYKGDFHKRDKSARITKLRTTLEARETKRGFKDARGPSKSDIIDLLENSLSIRKELKVKNQAQKFYFFPNGGAISDFNLFLQVNKSSDLSTGRYFYDFEQKGLKWIGESNLWTDEVNHGAQESWLKENGIPQVLLFFTTNYMLRRTKYDGVALQNSLVSAGAIIQNLYLNSVELGLRICPIGGVNQKSIANLFSYNSDIDVAILEVALGK